MGKLIDDLRVRTNKAIAKRKKEREKTKKRVGVVVFRSALEIAEAKLQMSADDCKRTCVIREIEAHDFKRGVSLEKLSRYRNWSSILAGEARFLYRHYAEMEGFECFVRPLKKPKRRECIGICGGLSSYLCYAELVVKW